MNRRKAVLASLAIAVVLLALAVRAGGRIDAYYEGDHP